jgi:hypothetical protein
MVKFITTRSYWIAHRDFDYMAVARDVYDLTAFQDTRRLVLIGTFDKIKEFERDYELPVATS